MAKIDLKKGLPHLYNASAKEVREVMVPSLAYIMIDGAGDPSTTPAYAEAVEALFSVSYTAKFALKRSTPSYDYAVMPLEGLWWADDFTAFTSGDRTQWQWTMMILQPSMVTPAVIEAAIKAVARKKNLPALSKLRLEEFTEGRCAQTLHIGPFTEEGPTIQRVLAACGESITKFTSPTSAAPPRRSGRRSCASRCSQSELEIVLRIASETGRKSVRQ